jgi:acetyl-CoA carboxylase/biotin carboxylase 1
MGMILMIFFVAAYEVYVRRAYKAYTLLSIDYEEGDTLDDGEIPTAVTWRFNLGQSHSPPSTPNIALGYVYFSLLH